MKILKLYIVFVIVSLIIGISNSFNHHVDDLSLEDGIIETETIEDIVGEVKNKTDNVTVDESDDITEDEIKENDIKPANNNAKKENISSDSSIESKNESNATENQNNEIKQDNIILEDNNDQGNNEINNHDSNNQDDDPVDTRNLDYSVHRGRVDCKDIKECMDISLPYQFKFKKSIVNSFYIEVITVNDNTLGYFIEYVFKDGNYKSIDECEKTGKQITDELDDKVISYSCDSSGILKINTNY